MRSRMLTLLTGAAIALAACSSVTPTQAPVQTQGAGGQTADTGGGGGVDETEQPAATTSGGAGPVGTSHGKVTFEITGTIQDSGEWGFVPAASVFSTSQGSGLSFTHDVSSQNPGLISIATNADGTVVVSYTGPKGQVPGASCKTTDWNIGVSSGSGKFECTAELSLAPSGAVLGPSKITGSFTANA